MTARLEIFQTAQRRLNVVEQAIITRATNLVNEGYDRHLLRLFIEEEISDWQKLDSTAISDLALEIQSTSEMVLKSGAYELAVLKTIFYTDR